MTDLLADDPIRNFRNQALLAIRKVCRRRRHFYSDDVWEVLGREHEGVDLREIGHAFRAAKASGWCVTTGEYRLVVARDSHKHLRPVWRSRIYDASNRMSR